MDTSPLLLASSALLSFAFACGIWRETHKPASPAVTPLSVLRLQPGDTLVLSTPSRLTPSQYEKLRSYLDEMERHTGARFAVLDGSLRVVAIGEAQ